MQREPLAGRVPVSLITGFLGSGKTTLISNLVKHNNMRKVAVIINEIGEIGIDHDLVTLSSENISLLANGCICCSVRTDMQDALRELFAERRAGLMIDFDRVIIETTGLADPAPVIQTLVRDTLLAAQYRLDGVVTLVDAVNGPGQIASQSEAVKQIVLADRLFITKTDLAEPKVLADLRQTIAQLNPTASIGVVINGVIAPDQLIGMGLASAKVNAQTLTSLRQFLGESLDQPAPADPADAAAQGEIYMGAKLRRHDLSIKSLSLRFDQPISWSSFSSALELLTSLRGNDLLRLKGIVNVEGVPMIVQGVQHIFHPPVSLV